MTRTNQVIHPIANRPDWGVVDLVIKEDTMKATIGETVWMHERFITFVTVNKVDRNAAWIALRRSRIPFSTSGMYPENSFGFNCREYAAKAVKRLAKVTRQDYGFK